MRSLASSSTIKASLIDQLIVHYINHVYRNKYIKNNTYLRNEWIIQLFRVIIPSKIIVKSNYSDY